MTRFKVQYEDGTIRTVNAQSPSGAKRAFIAEYRPPKGSRLVIWRMGESGDKQNFRV